MSNYAIEVDNLTKIYYPNIKLKESFSESLKSNCSKRKDFLEIKALNNVSFKLKKGEILGIIGDNGSGKSTLLKILSGITEPTLGSIKVNGKLVSILEIGTGFHPDLTGLENIYFTAEIYGMSSEEISKKENSIIEFSELGDFLDLPVKQYSSGMFMRLAFSIIIHLDADIILLDEVFSVGDFKFKEKSESALNQLIKKDKTVVFVSHDMKSIEKNCSQILVLESGSLINISYKSETIYEYMFKESVSDRFSYKDDNIGSIENEYRIIKKTDKISYEAEVLVSRKNADINNILLKCFSKDKSKVIYTHKSFYIELSYNQNEDVELFPSLNIYYNMIDLCIGLNPLLDFKLYDDSFFKTKGKKTLLCHIPQDTFNEGSFLIDLIFCNSKSKVVKKYRGVLLFNITYDNKLKRIHNYDGGFKGPLMPRFSWSFDG